MKTIYLKGIVGWDIFAEDLTNELSPNSREKVRIIGNSPGGDVSEGIEIYNVIKSYNGQVEFIIGAMAASMMSYIAMSVPLENRKGFENSSFMIHEASGVGFGRARDFKIKYERLEGINNIMASVYAKEFGKTLEEARDMMSEDKYFTGWESLVENNIISDVIDYKDVDFPQTEKEDETEWTFFGMENKKYEETTAKSFMYEAEDKIKKDFEKFNDKFEKAVAFLDIGNEINSDESENDEPIEIKKTEVVMSVLQDFLKSNPEAQAEYEKDLDSARSDERTNTKESVAKILASERITLSKTATKALDTDMTYDQYAIEALEEERSKRDQNKKDNKDKNKGIFAGLSMSQEPSTQAKDVKDELDGKRKEPTDEELKAEAQKLFGGKK